MKMSMNYGNVLIEPDKFSTLRFIFVVLKLNLIIKDIYTTIGIRTIYERSSVRRPDALMIKYNLFEKFSILVS